MINAIENKKITHFELMDLLAVGATVEGGGQKSNIKTAEKIYSTPNNPGNANGLPIYIKIETENGQKCQSNQILDFINNRTITIK